MSRLPIARLTTALLLIASSTTFALAGTNGKDGNRLQAPLAASFNAAETGAGMPKRYVISRDAQDLVRWAAADKALRAAIFSRRNARGAIEIQSIAVLASNAQGHALHDWKPSASLSLAQPGASESELFAAIRKMPSGDSKPETLSYDQMLTRIRAYAGVVALVSVAPDNGAATLAFIPDNLNIAVTGTPEPASSATAVSTAANSGQAAQEAARGEIISSKPGETVRMIRDDNGNPAQLQFEVDPSQFNSTPANPG